MTLYSCRHSGDQYRISKFNDDMNVQSSYLCTETECDCPAGVRPICRHREMLPRFIERKTVDSDWWFDYDRGGWVQMGNGEEPLQLEDFEGPHSTVVSVVGFEPIDDGSNPSVAAKPLPPAHYPSWRRI